MADPVAPIEPVPGKAAAPRVLPAIETPPFSAGDQPVKGRRPQWTPSPAHLEVSGDLVETHAQFVYDEDSRLLQVKIIDNATERVVREIPPNALVELAASLRAYQEVGHSPRPSRLPGSPTPPGIPAPPKDNPNG